MKHTRKLPIIMYVLFWLLIVSVTGGVCVMQLSHYRVYQRELIRLDQDIIQEQSITTQLTDQLEHYGTDEYIEQLAREWLGYIKQDELLLINVAH